MLGAKAPSQTGSVCANLTQDVPRRGDIDARN
jgi:hypothetical protein